VSKDTDLLAADLHRLTGCPGNHPVFAISELERCDCCGQVRATARLSGGGMNRLCRDCLWEERHAPLLPRVILTGALLVLLLLTAWVVWGLFR
jgi:hypothetical protein